MPRRGRNSRFLRRRPRAAPARAQEGLRDRLPGNQVHHTRGQLQPPCLRQRDQPLCGVGEPDLDRGDPGLRRPHALFQLVSNRSRELPLRPISQTCSIRPSGVGSSSVCFSLRASQLPGAAMAAAPARRAPRSRSTRTRAPRVASTARGSSGTSTRPATTSSCSRTRAGSATSTVSGGFPRPV